MYSSTNDLFDDHAFPATTEEIIETYGDEEIEVADGSVRLSEVFAVFGTETFESAEDARLSFYCGLGSDAIGRKMYTDRDPEPPGTAGHDIVSF